MIKILAVDDNPIQLKLYVKYFEKHGYQVETYEKSSEVINKKNFEEYDIVLTDMMMPEYSGIDILNHIREHHPIIPIFMLTAHSNIRLAIEFIKMGGNEYLEKPADMAVLKIKLDNAVEQYRLKQKLQQSEITKLIYSESTAVLKEAYLCIFHDLFKPLNVILSFSKKGFIHFKDMDDELKKSYFENIYHSGDLMLERLKSIITYTGQQHDTSKVEEIDLTDELNQTFSEISLLIDYPIEFKENQLVEICSDKKKLLFAVKIILLHMQLFSTDYTTVKVNIKENDSVKNVFFLFEGESNFTYQQENFSNFNINLLDWNKPIRDPLNLLNIVNRTLNTINASVEAKILKKEDSFIKLTFHQMKESF